MTQTNEAHSPRVAAITGASSGIGAVVAKTLATQGWNVIILGRNQVRLDAVQAEIRAAAGHAQVTAIVADLSVMAEAARAAREIAAATSQLDLLVNNAGATLDTRYETVDGLEETFAGNHLGHFLLTDRLLPLLRATPGAQVINVASMAHAFAKDMHWDDLQLKNKFSTSQAYAQSKLANILFTRELARREAATGVRVNAVHPGMVASNFPNRGDFVVRMAYRLTRLFTLTPTQGADTILWLATSAEAASENGGYFVKRKRTSPSAAAQSDAGARRLWDASAALVAASGA